MNNPMLRFIGMVLGSLVFGLIFVVIFVNATEVDCELQSDSTYNCQVKTMFLGTIPTFHKSVEHVTGLTVTDDGCSDGCSYRAEFVAADGYQTPITSVYTDRSVVSKRIAELGSMLNSHQEKFTYTIKPPWWVLYLVGGLTLLTILLTAPRPGK